MAKHPRRSRVVRAVAERLRQCDECHEDEQGEDDSSRERLVRTTGARRHPFSRLESLCCATASLVLPETSARLACLSVGDRAQVPVGELSLVEVPVEEVAGVSRNRFTLLVVAYELGADVAQVGQVGGAIDDVHPVHQADRQPGARRWLDDAGSDSEVVDQSGAEIAAPGMSTHTLARGISNRYRR
jgi:hypothetical protein